jgi:hypothetical protein
MRVSIRRYSDAVRRRDHLKLVEAELVDRRGQRRPAVTLPGHNAGLPSGNLGRKLPPEILTAGEVSRLIAACGRGPGGCATAR